MYLFRQLGYLHQHAVGRAATKYEPCLLELLDVLGVDLVAMAMTLAYLFSLVGRMRYCPLFEHARVRAKAHRAAVVLVEHLFFLVGDDVDNGMRRVFVYLARVGAREPGLVAGIPRLAAVSPSS